MFLRRIEYDEVIRLIKQVNPVFGKCAEDFINQQDNKEDYYAYIGEYPYGYPIINSEGLNLCESVPEDLKRDFESDTKRSPGDIPFGLSLENTTEVFLTDKFGIIESLTILNPGDTIGSFEAVDLMHNLDSCSQPLSNFRPLWQAVAGTRSIFLPILTNSAKTKGDLDDLLTKYRLSNLETYTKKFPSLTEDIFPFSKDIINCKSSGINWTNKLIFFTDKWIEPVGTQFSNFHQCIYNIAWEQSAVFRNKQALISQLSEYLTHHRGTQTYNYCMKILVDLFQIGLGLKSSYQILPEKSSQINGPFLEFRDLLKTELGFSNQHPPIVIEPVNVRLELQKFGRIECLYPAASMGQPFSNLGSDHLATLELTALFFKPIGKILQNENFIKYFESVCGCKVDFQLYGKTGAKRNGLPQIDVLDIRSIFNIPESEQQKWKINYSHPFLRGCIKILFTRSE